MNLSTKLPLAASLMLLTGGAAQAAINCSAQASAPSVIFTGARNDSSGTITVNCTRDTTGWEFPQIYVGIAPAAGNNRRLLRHGGGNGNADRLDASLYKNNSTTDWGDASSGERVSGYAVFVGNMTSTSFTLDYDFRIPAQNGKTAGIYDQLYTANVRLTANGPIHSSTSFRPTASVPQLCFVGQVASGRTSSDAVSPTDIVLNYESFSPSAQMSSMGFTVECTLGTTYSLAVSPAGGTLLGLTYTLRLNNNAASWTNLVGSGLAQPYSVTATIPAGQSGTCGIGMCTAKQPATITVTY